MFSLRLRSISRSGAGTRAVICDVSGLRSIRSGLGHEPGDDMNNMFRCLCVQSADRELEHGQGDGYATHVFCAAHAFNQPIGSWNTGKVTDMRHMFYYAYAFNQPIGSWNTSAVTDMSVMFHNAYAFNQPIGSWNTNAVTTMSGMFQNAYAFNQPLNTWNPIAVTSMDSMFNYALAFNQPISGNTWNTPVLVSASNMFACANAWLSAHRLMAGGSGSDGPPVSWTASTSGGACVAAVHCRDTSAVHRAARS